LTKQAQNIKKQKNSQKNYFRFFETGDPIQISVGIFFKEMLAKN